MAQQGMGQPQGAPYGYAAQGAVNPQGYYAGGVGAAGMTAAPGGYGGYPATTAPAGGIQPGYGKPSYGSLFLPYCECTVLTFLRFLAVLLGTAPAYGGGVGRAPSGDGSDYGQPVQGGAPKGTSSLCIGIVLRF